MQTTGENSNKMYLFLFILTVAAFAGLQGWRTIFNNFVVEVAGLNGGQIGIVQSVREIPGFLALLVIYVLFIFSEHRLAALSVIVLGVGIGLTGYFPTFPGIIMTTLIMSFGFHYYETLNQSLTLQYFDKGQAPVVFGRLRAVAAATSIGIGIVIFLVAGHLSYKAMFAGVGVLIAGLGLVALFMDPTRKDLTVQSKKMIFRRHYWLFYVLTLLSGARRQIFVAFAVFLMVEKFQYSVQEVTVLFVINNLINWIANPWIGRAIARYGERKILSLEYSTLIIVFLTYAFTESKAVVAVAYIIDHLVFNFAIAVRTFFQKIGEPSDIAGSMAMGFTINHVAAVVIPVFGGLLWLVDYRIPFLMGCVISILSLIFAQRIDVHVRRGAPRKV